MSIHHTTAKGLRLSNKVDHIHIPMYSNYRDGSGRDSYVGNNNGGNTMLHVPTARGVTDGAVPTHKFKFKIGAHGHLGSPAISGGAGSPRRSHSNSPSPSSNKKQKYRQDGSGRDTYILDDNGGFYPMKETASYMNTFQERLREGKQFEQESTYEYQLKRNERMKGFMSRDKQEELVAASAAGHNRLHDPLRRINGFLINQDAVAQKTQKRQFQMYHADVLSIPKKRKEKYEDRLEQVRRKNNSEVPSSMKFLDKFKTNNCQTGSTIQQTDGTIEKHDVEVTPAMKQVLDKLFGRTEEKEKGGWMQSGSGQAQPVDQRANTERHSPRASPGRSPRAPQRFSEKHQVYAHRRAEDVPLIERQRSYINYARNKLQLDKIDHKQLSNSAILNMSFPRRNKQFLSDSSTNITDQTLNALKSSFALSPNASGNMRYANGAKLREHNLKFVSAKDMQLAASHSDRLGGRSPQQWPSASRQSLPQQSSKGPKPLKMTATQDGFLKKGDEPSILGRSGLFQSTKQE